MDQPGAAACNPRALCRSARPKRQTIVYYTSSVSGTLGEYIYGGTSFVDPELNGVASLFVQALDGPIGLLNPALYQIATSPDAYRGRHPAFRDITQGNNWYWNAGPGYDQATGVGVPDVANLLQGLCVLHILTTCSER
jgi:kumamolisin